MMRRRASIAELCPAVKRVSRIPCLPQCSSPRFSRRSWPCHLAPRRFHRSEFHIFRLLPNDRYRTTGLALSKDDLLAKHDPPKIDTVQSSSRLKEHSMSLRNLTLATTMAALTAVGAFAFSSAAHADKVKDC